MKIVIIFVNFVKNVSLADESWYYTYQFETNLYKKLYVVFLCDFLNLYIKFRKSRSLIYKRGTLKLKLICKFVAQPVKSQ